MVKNFFSGGTRTVRRSVKPQMRDTPSNNAAQPPFDIEAVVDVRGLRLDSRPSGVGVGRPAEAAGRPSRHRPPGARRPPVLPPPGPPLFRCTLCDLLIQI